MGREADQVVAKLNYIPSGLHELPLYKGEKLTVVDATGEWWRVKNALGQTGLIPSSYIRVNGDSFLSRLFRKSSRGKKSGAKKPPVANEISSPQAVSHVSGLNTANEEKFPSSSEESKSFNDNVLMPKFITPSKGGSENYFDTSCDNGQSPTAHHELVDFVAKVRYTYKAQRPDELELKPGEEVVVLERASDGWWRGVNQSSLASGWFPSNYVVQNNHGHLPINDEKKRDSAFEESCGASSGANVGAVPTIQGVAIASYQPKTQLELKIAQGDQLHILRECSQNAQLWEASNQSNRGETGLVQKSFVRISSSSSSQQPTTTAAAHQLHQQFSRHASPQLKHSYSHNSGGGGSKTNLSTPLSVSVDSPMKHLQAPFSGIHIHDKDRDSFASEKGMGFVSPLALPFELPPRMGMFQNEDWYFGRIFRNQCEILFKYYGDFGDYLIRDSESNPGDFTLSLKANIKNRHFLVKSLGGFPSRLKIGSKEFSTMEELLNHYKTNAIFTDASASRLMLIKPLKVPARM